MTLEALLITLRARGVKITDKGAALDFEPPSLVTAEEAEFIKANAEAFAVALRAEPTHEALSIDLDIDAAVNRQREAEAEAIARRCPPPTKVTRFRTVDGLKVPLHRLTAADVQRLRARGALTDDEAREWLGRFKKPVQIF